jgi:hypothetical protein
MCGLDPDCELFDNCMVVETETGQLSYQDIEYVKATLRLICMDNPRTISNGPAGRIGPPDRPQCPGHATGALWSHQTPGRGTQCETQS